MLHADHSIPEIIAHVLIAALFVIGGIKNIFIRQEVLERMAALHIPAPPLVLYSGFTVQFIGAGMVLADLYAGIGAMILIVFTVASTWMFHRYWLMPDPVRRNYHMLLGLNNFGVVGGLFLLV